MNGREPCVLTINAGSSSIKFAVYKVGSVPARILVGKVDRIGLSGTRMEVLFEGANAPQRGPFPAPDRHRAVARLVDWIELQPSIGSVKAVGHRVVHGMNHTQPERITPALLVKLRQIVPFDAYWRAANYLSVGQIYLYDNPLLKRPLTLADVKHMLLGHWGTTPGQNFIYVHLNRVIKKYDLDMIYVSGPGHGGPAVVANTYLEGTYSEIYPNISQDEAGLRKLFIQFSFPGGIPSHASPECPGSIHEGGELGYSLSHSFGAVFDNPDLIVACVVGDGEAETGPLATAWHSNKFLDPSPTARCCPSCISTATRSPIRPSSPASPARSWSSCFAAMGGRLTLSRATNRTLMHEAMAATLDTVIEQIRKSSMRPANTGPSSTVRAGR
jgi:phosphoketolase